MEDLLDKYIILLSSGELRKYKLAANLFTKPKVLIIENPFIGLDAETRDQVKGSARLARCRERDADYSGAVED